jgi:hypothetical protein
VPSHVTVRDLSIGLPVEYLGDANPEVVLSDSLRATGLVLYSGHPGRVWSTTLQHVQVTWVGLEDEPATYAVGFSVADEPVYQVDQDSNPEYYSEESQLSYLSPVSPDSEVTPDSFYDSSEDAFYPGLGLLTEDEFGLRERAIQASLRSGKYLSESIPPWRPSGV